MCMVEDRNRDSAEDVGFSDRRGSQQGRKRGDLPTARWAASLANHLPSAGPSVPGSQRESPPHEGQAVRRSPLPTPATGDGMAAI